MFESRGFRLNEFMCIELGLDLSLLYMIYPGANCLPSLPLLWAEKSLPLSYLIVQICPVDNCTVKLLVEQANSSQIGVKFKLNKQLSTNSLLLHLLHFFLLSQIFKIKGYN
jgi:hypothetical protein